MPRADGMTPPVPARLRSVARPLARGLQRLQSRGSCRRRPAVWYFITWHAEVERLFRLFGSLSRAANTYVISVGGSDPIERFPQVSALMLAGDVHLHYRPSVSWGGQKLLFQNVFDIMECFSARTEEDAVFQIICNKTYPLAGPIEFAKQMGRPVIGRFTRSVATRCRRRPGTWNGRTPW